MGNTTTGTTLALDSGSAIRPRDSTSLARLARRPQPPQAWGWDPAQAPLRMRVPSWLPAEDNLILLLSEWDIRVLVHKRSLTRNADFRGTAGLCSCSTLENEYIFIGAPHLDGRHITSSDIRQMIHRMWHLDLQVPQPIALGYKCQLSPLARAGIARSVTCTCRCSTTIDIMC